MDGIQPFYDKLLNIVSSRIGDRIKILNGPHMAPGT